MEKCGKCDQANNYFEKNSQCVKCEIYGCLECQSLKKCKTCNADKYYDVNEYGLCDQMRIATIIWIVSPIFAIVVSLLIVFGICTYDGNIDCCFKRQYRRDAQRARERKRLKEKKDGNGSNARIDTSNPMKEVI